MAMIWRLDTCDCVLEYTGANDAASYSRRVHACQAHAALAGALQHSVVHGENTKKNRAVIQVATSLIREVDPPGFSAGEVGWRFDAARVLYVSIPPRVSVTVAQRAAIAADLQATEPTAVLE